MKFKNFSPFLVREWPYHIHREKGTLEKSWITMKTNIWLVKQISNWSKKSLAYNTLFSSLLSSWKKKLKQKQIFNIQNSKFKLCHMRKNLCCSSKLIKICLSWMILNLMSGSCHLGRALNVKIGGECQIFVLVFFFNCGRV